MNEINQNSQGSDLSASLEYTPAISINSVRRISLAVAIFASAVSLGVSVFAGLHRADSFDEQVWSVTTALVSVVCLHLAPLVCRFVSLGARFILGALWLLAAFVVLRGQVDVLSFANMHAADKRAESVATVAIPSTETELPGRGLTAITQDIAQASIELARVEARHCVGECRSLRIRKTELSAQLATLHAEASEAKSRATEHEWIREQTGRAQELRESRRADPATSLVAHWLGTTEARLNTLLNLVCVVVLEGVACFAWYFAGLRRVSVGRTAVASDHQTTMPQHEPVVSLPAVAPDSRVGSTAVVLTVPVGLETVADGTRGDTELSEDELLVAQIHEAVVAGRMKRNLASIRKFLECGQTKATRLNQLYVSRFG